MSSSKRVAFSPHESSVYLRAAEKPSSQKNLSDEFEANRQYAILDFVENNADSFLYNHLFPGVSPAQNEWSEAEKQMLMDKLNKYPPNRHWGLFSLRIKGRTGAECRNAYRDLVQAGKMKALSSDPLIIEPELRCHSTTGIDENQVVPSQQAAPLASSLSIPKENNDAIERISSTNTISNSLSASNSSDPSKPSTIGTYDLRPRPSVKLAESWKKRKASDGFIQSALVHESITQGKREDYMNSTEINNLQQQFFIPNLDSLCLKLDIDPVAWRVSSISSSSQMQARLNFLRKCQHEHERIVQQCHEELARNASAAHQPLELFAKFNQVMDRGCQAVTQLADSRSSKRPLSEIVEEILVKWQEVQVRTIIC
eukprot:TRINITY_DN5539_c0_g1_i4.p1 TRINITY_DN5539_c0_g1~~TRINITY_DN5539_c0_g1_i4.p1  ORF type:complete len:370 (-),score=62.50 TRINITY_DN5539_c0_g1_i4:411-1520(-)